MKIIITCGPSYEPIDQARRLTNFSTGRLGITLSNFFTARGWDVTCLKGEQATCADPLHAARKLSFTTNDDLAAQLSDLGDFPSSIHALADAAAGNSSQAQYLILSTSANGDALNCNVPGTYDLPSSFPT